MYNQNLLNAVNFAKKAHKNQFRKYTELPYIVHPIQVKEIVENFIKEQDILISAILHDVVEDTKYTLQDIETNFNKQISYIVEGLTDIRYTQNRAENKHLNNKRISNYGYNVKSIKLADIISNVSDVITYDKNFAKVYLKEKREQLKYLRDGHRTLYKIVNKIIEDYFNEN